MDLTAVHIRREPSLTMKIYGALSERIMDGYLKPGKSIIIEQIASQLGVSPTPVRESLIRLAEQGVITKGENGRFSLRRLTPSYVRDTYLVRSVIEGLAAELAASRISESDLATIRDDLDDILTTINQGDYQQYIASADDIFRLIEGAADSMILSRELSVLRLHTGFVRSLTKKYIGDYVQTIHDELLVVADGLTARDPNLARQAMETYIRNSGRRVAMLLNLDEDI